MNLSFKTQGVKESLTMALSYLCCALLLCLSARYWYWAKARDTSEKVDLLPASAGFANHCWLLNYLALSFVFSQCLSSLWFLVFLLVACVGFIGILTLAPDTLRWEEMLLVGRGNTRNKGGWFDAYASIVLLSRLREELMLGLLQWLLAIKVLLHPIRWRNQGLRLRIHESLRLYHVSHGLTWVLIRYPAHILVAIRS